MDQNVLVLTEASSEIGLGHVNRICSVVNYLANQGFATTWRIRGGGLVKQDLPGDVSYEEWDNNSRVIGSIPKYELVIVDVYQVNQYILDLIACNARRSLFVIDGTLKYGKCKKGKDINVLFSSAYADKSLIGDDVKLLGGIDFLLFKDSFYKIDSLSMRQPYKSVVQSIIINIGGYYDADLMDKILMAIDDVYKATSIDILGTPKGQANITYSSRWNRTRSWFLNGDDYANRLLLADIVISNGGQSLNEALFLNRPCIVVPTADNQAKNIAFWQKKQVLANVGSPEVPDFVGNLKSKLELLRDKKSREKLTPLARVAFSRNPQEEIFKNIFDKNN